jgi:hypothetical protein
VQLIFGSEEEVFSPQKSSLKVMPNILTAKKIYFIFMARERKGRRGKWLKFMEIMNTGLESATVNPGRLLLQVEQNPGWNCLLRHLA